MQELIKELENNKKIKGTESVNIDYIINRLKSIDIFDEYIRQEVIFNIENLVNDINNWQEDADTTKEVENLKSEDINNIAYEISSDDVTQAYTSEILNETIEKTIYNYINNK